MLFPSFCSVNNIFHVKSSAKSYGQLWAIMGDYWLIMGGYGRLWAIMGGFTTLFDEKST